MKSPSKRSLIVLFIIISIICILFFAAIGRFNTPLANSIVVNVLAPFQSVTSAFQVNVMISVTMFMMYFMFMTKIEN